MSSHALALWRQCRAVALMSEGRTYQQIADEVSWANRGTAHRVVQQALTTQLVHDVDELRHLEGDRLDALQAALWPVGNGDFSAAMAVLKVMEQRAKLFNLYRHESAEERLWGMVRPEKATQGKQHDGDDLEGGRCPGP